jgi:hypothetical protein
VNPNIVLVLNNGRLVFSRLPKNIPLLLKDGNSLRNVVTTGAQVLHTITIKRKITMSFPEMLDNVNLLQLIQWDDL